MLGYREHSGDYLTLRRIPPPLRALRAVRTDFLFGFAADEPFDAGVAAGEAEVVYQILIDGLGVATLAQRQFDEIAIRFADARRGALAGTGSVDTSMAGFESRGAGFLRRRLCCDGCGCGRRWGQLRAKFGGHLVGRFWGSPEAPNTPRYTLHSFREDAN